MKHVKLFEQFVNEGAFVVWYEDQDGKHLLGTFHNKKAAEKYKSEEEDEMLNTKGVKSVGMMSKEMWYKKEAPHINESKTLDRDEMMAWLEQYLGFVSTSEKFNGSPEGIWISGENGDKYKGKRIYDYYSKDHKNREFGVLIKWEKELNERGWYSNWYDAGTVMIYPI